MTSNEGKKIKKWLLYQVLISVSISMAFLCVYHLMFRNFLPDVIRDQKNKILKVALEEISWKDSMKGIFMASHPNSFIEAATKGREGVVFIKPIRKNFENNTYPFQTGSGVIISEDGYIVTNLHVVGEAKQVEVVLADKRVFIGKVEGSDYYSDLALVKIEAINLPFLIMANSDSLQIGEWVLAVGNPFNLQSTVTAGIVSAKARNIQMLESQGIESFIQTDAAVNPGSSGGALINTDGKLVGINTAIMSEKGSYEGFSFAIPINVVKKVVTDLKSFGVVQRGWLGVEIEEVTAVQAEKYKLDKVSGVLVSSVLKDGAAQLAGIQENDIILQINSYIITNTASFMEQIAQFRPGETITLTFWRNQKIHVCKPVLKNHLNTYDPVAIYNSGVFSDLGVEVRNLDALEKILFGKNGSLVISITRGGLLHGTRMDAGFIIQQVDGTELRDSHHLKELLETKKGKQVMVEGIYKNYPGKYPYVFDMPD